MRVYAKLVFICNLCFIAAVIFRFIELARRTSGDLNAVIPLQPLQSTVVVLGYSAIFLNGIFFIFSILGMISRKVPAPTRWLLWFNLILFPIQIWFSFFFNF
ncbi:MAG: hypothetical protein ACOYLO_04615 [Ferruginibacter sp.]